MIDLHQVLARLSKERPIFHSEADFQHAIAWRLHQENTTASVRLEYPVTALLQSDGIGTAEPTAHVDVWMRSGTETTILELKYLTNKLKLTLDEEPFALKGHAAQDVRCYDVFKDVVRLERLVEKVPGSVGYVCVVTNDAIYWKPPGHSRSCFKDAFRMHDNLLISGTLAWGIGAAPGTIKNREQCLVLNGEYTACWGDYSNFPGERNGRFQYLLLGPITRTAGTANK